MTNNRLENTFRDFCLAVYKCPPEMMPYSQRNEVRRFFCAGAAAIIGLVREKGTSQAQTVIEIDRSHVELGEMVRQVTNAGLNGSIIH